MHYTFAMKLARIADAARGLTFVEMGGLGPEGVVNFGAKYKQAIAACKVELRVAIKDLHDTEGQPAFNAQAYVEDLMRKP